MIVKCSMCGREMQSYPFSSVMTCVKCTLDTKFEKIGVFKNISREEHERELQLDNIGVPVE